MKNSFDFTIISMPQIDLAGVFVLTDMENSMADCSALWEKDFMPKAMPLLKNAPAGAPTYGLSLVEDLQEGSFNYWACLPWTEEAPEGLTKTAIPAGSYVKCPAASLKEIGDVYQALFEYVQNNPDLDFNPGAPSIEEYPAEFPKPETLYIYMPVKSLNR